MTGVGANAILGQIRF